mgnify:FL=1
MRDIDKKAAENSINFLSKISGETNLFELKEGISKLLESQMQILMLTEASKDYIFKSISSPRVAEKKSSPSRATICILGTILGFIFSILIVIAQHFYYNNKEN